jgi:hypothetical protein
VKLDLDNAEEEERYKAEIEMLLRPLVLELGITDQEAYLRARVRESSS